MPNLPSLLPMPRKLKLIDGFYVPVVKGLIHLKSGQPQALLFMATRLQGALKTYYQCHYEIYAGKVDEHEQRGIVLSLDPSLAVRPQGYHLEITSTLITIQAATQVGLFYGCCTLAQLLQYYSTQYQPLSSVPGGQIPCLVIDDWPDFAQRGVMLDVSRDKVPTMQSLFDLVDMLASWKINQLQLNTEHSFAYQHHPEVWAKYSPITAEEILRLDAFCRERYIELVPNQNSFGHLEHWLRLPRYRPLAEAPEGFDFSWGHHDGPFSLCPLDEGSLSLLKGLYDELLPNFSSRQFNVGCDETFDVGQGRSKQECEKRGSGRVYMDFLLKIYQQVKERGFRMQFWGDIIMEHPEFFPELPKDVIALEWGYEANHPFEEHGEKFAQAGLSFYVCPGTSSWNSIAGRTDNCLGNLASAARNGKKYGADGYLITDWGDNGHWQALPVSFLGFAAGTAYSWCYQANQAENIQKLLNLYAFQDIQGGLGKLAYDLGNVYRSVGFEPHNASALFDILQRPHGAQQDKKGAGISIQTYRHTLEGIESISKSLTNINSFRSDQELLRREFELTIALLKHACFRGLYLSGSKEVSAEQLRLDLRKIVKEYRHIWLKRNRPGGLSDSLAHFKVAENDYRQN